MSSGRSTSPSNERSQGGGTRRPFVDREIDPTHLQVAECRSDRRQPGRCTCQRRYEEEPSMPAHHENQLRGEPRVEYRRAEHMKLKLPLGGGVTTPFDARLAPTAERCGFSTPGAPPSVDSPSLAAASPNCPPRRLRCRPGATAFGIVVTSFRQPDG